MSHSHQRRAAWTAPRPATSQADPTSLINNARDTLQIYSEEMDDTTITNDLTPH